MHRLHIGIMTWILWGSLILCGHGQSLPEWFTDDNVPKPPESGIHDGVGFFSKGSNSSKRISKQLRELKNEHGFHIYLIIEPVLISSSAPQLAARLQQSWLPEGDGLVIVYESDSRSLSFGRDIGDNPDPEKNSNRVPTHETAALLANATEKADTALPPQEYIEALTSALAQEFDTYFAQRKTPSSPGRSLRFGLLAIGGLTLLALAAIVVGSMSKLPSMSGTRTYRFPVVDRPERLGAPCGGGEVTTRRFSPKPRPGDPT